MEGNQIYSLEQVASAYEIILPDTCAICRHSRRRESGLISEQKEKDSNTHYKSYSFWKDHVLNSDKKNIFFIQEVIKELEENSVVKYKPRFDGKPNERRYMIRVKDHQKGFRPRADTSSFKRFAKNTKSVSSRGKSLLKLLTRENLILNLTGEEKERYDCLYDEFRNLIFLGENPLTGADYPLLIKSIVVSENRGKTALISNDVGIFNCWVELLKNPDLKIKGNLDFFFRNEYNGFLRK